MCIFFFVKQKTAYERRISDWSSDVCSSDLESIRLANAQQKTVERVAQLKQDMEATKELHRLSALQGKLLDADGTTVLMDYFAEYGISTPATVNVTFSAIAAGGLGVYFQRHFYDPIIPDRTAHGHSETGKRAG